MSDSLTFRFTRIDRHSGADDRLPLANDGALLHDELLSPPQFSSGHI